MAYRVTLIPGDGIGPEVTEATKRVLEATGVAFQWD
ncbi:MAG: NAD-dependent isocitrate dehydrogenase, partial [Dehalococcoidales bacterium]